MGVPSWLIVEQLGNEVLVYDQRSHRAHALSGPVAWLFASERGLPLEAPKPSRGELAAARHVLEQLDLDRSAPRRRARRGVVGAAALTALAVTVCAPHPAAAASACGTADCTKSASVSMHLPCTTAFSTCGHCTLQVGQTIGVCLPP